MVSLQGMKMDALENVSVTVSMVSYVCDFGSFVMKSIAGHELAKSRATRKIPSTLKHFSFQHVLLP